MLTKTKKKVDASKLALIGVFQPKSSILKKRYTAQVIAETKLAIAMKIASF